MQSDVLIVSYGIKFPQSETGYKLNSWSQMDKMKLGLKIDFPIRLDWNAVSEYLLCSAFISRKTIGRISVHGSDFLALAQDEKWMCDLPVMDEVELGLKKSSSRRRLELAILLSDWLVCNRNVTGCIYFIDIIL